MEKLFWGATEIAEYANVSRSSAINFYETNACHVRY